MSYAFDITEYHQVPTQKARRQRRGDMVEWLEMNVGPITKSFKDGTAYEGEGWAFKVVKEFLDGEDDGSMHIRVFTTKHMLYLEDQGKAAMFKLTWCNV